MVHWEIIIETASNFTQEEISVLQNVTDSMDQTIFEHNVRVCFDIIWYFISYVTSIIMQT